MDKLLKYRVAQRGSAKFLATALIAILFWMGPAYQVIAAPKVVASIKPVHGLVASIMSGIGKPTLLVPANASPHHYHLKPSDARKLAQADLLIRIGPELETFLEKPIKTLFRGTVMDLIKIPHLMLLTADEGADHGSHKHDHEHGHGQAGKDPHIWLDPKNAILMANQIAGQLATMDPENAKRYRANAEMVISKIRNAARGISDNLTTVTHRPFILYHRAFLYFQHRFQLGRSEVIVKNTHRKAGARRIKALRRLLQQKDVACIFTEPQFDSRIAKVIAEGTQTKILSLDPVGSTLTSDTDYYPKFLTEIGRQFQTCFRR